MFAEKFFGCPSAGVRATPTSPSIGGPADILVRLGLFHRKRQWSADSRIRDGVPSKIRALEERLRRSLSLLRLRSPCRCRQTWREAKYGMLSAFRMTKPHCTIWMHE